MKNKLRQLTLLIGLTAVAHGQTAIIDFNTDDSGNAIVAGDGTTGSGYNDLNTTNLQPYAGIYGNNQGVTFTSSQTLTVYNTDFGGADLSIVGADNDLEPEYEGGNNVALLGADHNFGNALIIQEAAVNIDTPNDEGGGGSFTLTSDLALSTLVFDILDVDQATSVTLTFTSSAGVTVDVDLELFEDGSGDANFETLDVEFGDRHSNNIEVTVADLEAHRIAAPNADSNAITDVVAVTFTSNTSGGLGNVELTVIPEPSSSLLAGLGFLTLAFRRRR